MDIPAQADTGGNIVRGALFQNVYLIKCSPWRSCDFHPRLRLFLIIYVDFKLAGPQANLDKEWQLLQEASEGCPTGIEIYPPTDVGRYLGCEHHLSMQCAE
eukprot:8015557-Pyramimonas_sp.AAC.1